MTTHKDEVYIVFQHLKTSKKIGYESYWHLKIVACAKKSSNFEFSSRGKLTQVTLFNASDGFFEPNGGCVTLNFNDTCVNLKI